MSTKPIKCLYCNRDSQQVPLINLNYRDGEYWICPQHLPILLHSPAKLADVLPGAENMTPSAHDDH